MSLHVMVRTATISPLNKSSEKIQKQEVTQQSAANDRDEVIVPILSSSDDNPDVPYFAGFPSFPQVQLNHYEEDPADPAQTERPLRRGDEFKGDRPLPNEDPDYYDENQETDYKRNTSPKPKMYKAVERVYYYPQDEGETEPSKNRRELNAMKEYIPENYGPYDHNDDPEDVPEDYGNRNSHHSIQMQGNPPSNDQQENYDNNNDNNNNEQESDGTQVSIANDVKEFGREAVDEANRFEKFLNNLRNFAVDSEKDYANSEKQNQESDDRPIYQDDTPNTNLRGSMAAHPSDDRARDYEQVGQYGSPDDYDKEKRSYQNQRDKMNKGGHKYHKDRRRPRPRKPISDEEMEQQRREVSSLIDSEPDEADYLSNSDVVSQLKKSEHKYNTGIDPVYSSQRDFDEVKRLEKIIENVALLNKEKEKNAAEAHDQQEISETSVKNVQIKDGVKTKEVKKKAPKN